MALSTIRTISPSTNKVIHQVPGTSIEEAREIAGRSKTAFKEFKALSLDQRRSIIERALKLIQERRHEPLGRELSEQMGRPIAYSHKEIETMQTRADYLLAISDEALAAIPCSEENGFKRLIKKVPVGPMLIIFAWNVC